MDDDLICNYKKCRKRLNTHAWVTSCSHIFCDEDGSREFGKQPTCPACQTQLPGKYDIIRVDLQPSEQYKSMVLAGQRPEVIMEICSRAMSFWAYQAHQERAYQEYCAAKAAEKAQQQESYYEQVVAVSQGELASVKSQVSALKRELDELRTKYSGASDKLQEKNRQYQKLQGMYEMLRRRTITPSTFDNDHSIAQHQHKLPLRHHFELPLGAMPDKDNAGLSHGHLEVVQHSKQPLALDLPLFPSSSVPTALHIPIPAATTVTTSSMPCYPLPITSSLLHLPTQPNPPFLPPSQQPPGHHQGKPQEVAKMKTAPHPNHPRPNK